MSYERLTSDRNRRVTEPVRRLQRSLGNAATSRLLAPRRGEDDAASAARAAPLSMGPVAVQRMLIPILNPDWKPQKALIITRNAPNLAKTEEQGLKEASDIASLKPGEPLWLYSHGSPSSFGGKSPTSWSTG